MGNARAKTTTTTTIQVICEYHPLSTLSVSDTTLTI